VIFCHVIRWRISVFGIDFQFDIFVLQLAGKMAKVARKQVNAEKKRLIEARNIANSEKRLYVKVVFCISFFVYLYIPFFIHSPGEYFRKFRTGVCREGRRVLNPDPI